MTRPSTYEAWDRALDGSLGDLLLKYRSDGLSYDAIVFELRTHHDIAISRDTIGRWLRIAEDEAKAS